MADHADTSPAARPHLLVAVLGTGTEVGKTWVSAATLAALRAQGWMVAARKPAQSFDPAETNPDGGPVLHDSQFLSAATGEPDADVCPAHRRYPVALAPPMAARRLGLPSFTITDLASEVAASWGGRAADLGLVESAGGVASPAADDGHSGDLVDAVLPDLVVLVADATLGSIHAVRSSLAAFGRTDVVVHLNRFNAEAEVQALNRDWLRGHDGLVVTTSVDELAELLAATIPRHCPGCGELSSNCDGSCRRPLDPDRYCPRCGRRTSVLVTPAGHRATCRVHGEVDEQ